MIPLFPLQTVLFPGAALPLYVFEPRYRALVADCLEGDQTFGVVRIREGEEVGGPCVPYDVGTLARIVGHRPLTNGRIMLVAEGVRRFRLEASPSWEPYPMAPVALMPDAVHEPELGDRVRKLLHGYLEASAAYHGEEPPERPLPDEPESLGWLAAATLPAGLDDRQELLELPGDDRLRRLSRMLEEALIRIGHMAEISRLRADVVAYGHRFSMN